MLEFFAFNPNFKGFALARRVFANQNFCVFNFFIKRLNRAFHAGDLLIQFLIAHIVPITHFNRAENDDVFTVFVRVLNLIHSGFEHLVADLPRFSEMNSAAFSRGNCFGLLGKRRNRKNARQRDQQRDCWKQCFSLIETPQFA